MKIEFSSQRREMLLFLTTNMAAVTSRANQLLLCHLDISTSLDKDKKETEISQSTHRNFLQAIIDTL